MEINQGRPVPLHGRVQDRIIDLEWVIRKAEADDVYAPDETRAIIAAARALESDAGKLSEDAAVVCALLAGSDGCRTARFKRRLTAIWKRENVTFLGFHGEENLEPTHSRAA